MRALKISVLLMFVGVLALAALPVAAGRDLGHETLPKDESWASFGVTVTGGLQATANHIYTVTNRLQLVNALRVGGTSSSAWPNTTPKIIYISGTIDFNVDDNNAPLACKDYYRSGYTLEGFLAAYDPATWGRVAPSGPMEDARVASKNAQQARVRMKIGSNTTIVGLGDSATVRGAWFDVRPSSGSTLTNVIIRNINFQDTYDCFPEWSPTDGTLGSWNSVLDSISLRNSEHVWIDHNSFQDLATADRLAPMYFGVLYQQHDGLVDITNASDYVTVSWNRFFNHDKVMLIGGSNDAPADVGKLRVTVHHNLFDTLVQRMPRVRFGQVHVYNNYYKIVDDPAYEYAWGVGVESRIYAENNYFQTDQTVTPAQIIHDWTENTPLKVIFAKGTRVNGTPGGGTVDVVAAYNAANDPDLSTDVGWVPPYSYKAEDAQKVVGSVHSGAGPFNW